MAKSVQTVSVFSKRLKHARLAAGLSQEKLGLLAGLDEFTASARMNQYERSVHQPDYSFAVRIAVVLKIPVSYLFEADEKVAEIIYALGKLGARDRSKAAAYIQTLSE